MDKLWTVVQFTSCGSVEAIPSLWIKDGFCYWPSLPSNRLTKAIIGCEAADPNWLKFPIRPFRNSTFDDYAKAREKARVAEDTSDLQSDMDAGSMSKKRKKIPKRFSESYSDDSDSVLPPPPAIKPRKQLVKPREKLSEVNENVPVEASISETTQTLPSEEQPTTVMDAHTKTIIEQLHLLRCLMSDMLARIERMEQAAQKAGKKGHKKKSLFEIDITFPVSSEEDWRKLECHLKDDKNFKDAATELSRIGGSNTANFIKRVIKSLMADSLATEYSWLGKRAKKRFVDTLLAKLLIAASKLAHPSASEKDAEMAIQMWLRRSAERTRRTQQRF